MDHLFRDILLDNGGNRVRAAVTVARSLMAGDRAKQGMPQDLESAARTVSQIYGLTGEDDDRLRAILRNLRH